MASFDYPSALKNFEQVHQKDKGFMAKQTLMNLGECAYKLEKNEKALGYY